MSKRPSSITNLNRTNIKNNTFYQRNPSPYMFFKIDKFCDRKSTARTNCLAAMSRNNHKNKSEINTISHCLKSMVLSNKTFTKYITNYVDNTQEFCFKSPKNTLYPLKKNFQYLPISKDYNTQKNLKKNLSVVEFKIREMPYGYKYGDTKIIIDKEKMKEKKYEEKKAKLFKNFSEGDFNNSELLKNFGIGNIDIYNNQNIKKTNFDFLLKCIYNDDIENIQNFCDSKNITFKVKNIISKSNIVFDLSIFSLSIKLYYTKKKTPNPKNQKLFLPFKYLPLFYLLDYSSFKTFLSEIICFDNDSFQFIDNGNLNKIIQKYTTFLKTGKSLEYKNDSLIFNKNEFLFDNFFDFIIINDEKKLLYKLKISFPKIKFKIINNNIIIKNNLNKHILLKIIAKNFIDWEKLILYDLFYNSKFRIIINSILTNNTKYNYKMINLNKIFLSTNKNYEFFIADAKIKSCFYFIFNPYIIFILNGVGKNKKFQKIELNLLESKNLHELSTIGGAMNTLLKCMNINTDTNFVSFKLNMGIILDDISDEEKKDSNNFSGDDIFSNTENKSMNFSMSRSRITEKYMTKYKNENMEIVLFDCLLNKIKINTVRKEKFFIKVPRKLLKAILYNKKNIPEIIFECGNEIINDEEEIFIQLEEINMLHQASNIKKLNSDLEKYFQEKNMTINQRKKLKSFKYSKTKNNIFLSSAAKQRSTEMDKLFNSYAKLQMSKENKRYLNLVNKSPRNIKNEKILFNSKESNNSILEDEISNESGKKSGKNSLFFIGKKKSMKLNLHVSYREELKEKKIKGSTTFKGEIPTYKLKRGLTPKK